MTALRRNTLLHLAADRPDFFLLRGLLGHDIDPLISNELGQTAVDVIRERAADQPHRYPADQFEALLASRDGGKP